MVDSGITVPMDSSQGLYYSQFSPYLNAYVVGQTEPPQLFVIDVLAQQVVSVPLPTDQGWLGAMTVYQDQVYFMMWDESTVTEYVPFYMYDITTQALTLLCKATSPPNDAYFTYETPMLYVPETNLIYVTALLGNPYLYGIDATSGQIVSVVNGWPNISAGVYEGIQSWWRNPNSPDSPWAWTGSYFGTYNLVTNDFTVIYDDGCPSDSSMWVDNVAFDSVAQQFYYIDTCLAYGDEPQFYLVDAVTGNYQRTQSIPVESEKALAGTR